MELRLARSLRQLTLLMTLFLVAGCAPDIDQQRVRELRALPQSQSREVVARILDREWAASPFMFRMDGILCNAEERVPIQFVQINRVAYDALLRRLYIFGEELYGSRCRLLMIGRVISLSPADLRELSAALAALGARLD